MVGCHRQAAGTARDDAGPIRSRKGAGVSAFGSHDPAKVALAKQVVHLQEKKMLVEQRSGVAALVGVGLLQSVGQRFEVDGNAVVAFPNLLVGRRVELLHCGAKVGGLVFFGHGFVSGRRSWFLVLPVGVNTHEPCVSQHSKRSPATIRSLSQCSSKTANNAATQAISACRVAAKFGGQPVDGVVQVIEFAKDSLEVGAVDRRGKRQVFHCCVQLFNQLERLRVQVKKVCGSWAGSCVGHVSVSVGGKRENRFGDTHEPCVFQHSKRSHGGICTLFAVLGWPATFGRDAVPWACGKAPANKKTPRQVANVAACGQVTVGRSVLARGEVLFQLRQLFTKMV